MDNSLLLGPAAPEEGWVPAPRYLLRRRRILRQLRDVSPCRVMEVGCGAGMLLQELAARNFHCSALESSPDARRLIRRLTEKSGCTIDVNEAPNPGWIGSFPLVMAFEVLEHIEDDLAALTQWTSWLAPKGVLLLSVPAHPQLWSAADEWAGHYRRYRKRDVLRIARSAGLEIDHVECFGFPLGNITERMQARGIKRQQSVVDSCATHEANSHRSGIERDHVLRWYPAIRSPVGQLALVSAFAAQALSSRLPLGNGYLLRAHRK